MNATLERLKAEEEQAEAMFSNPTAHEGTPQESQEVAEAITVEQTEDEVNAAEYMEQAIVSPEQPEPVQQPEQAPKPKRTDWKKRFTNFKASADSTIYGLRSEISELKGALALAYDDVRKLKVTVQEQGAQKDPFEGVFSEEDEATFGADGLDVVKKATKTAIDKATKPLKDQLAANEKSRIDSLKRDASRTEQMKYNQFIKGLETLVPNYKEVDTNPEFLKWMKLPDTYSGITRSDLFLRAENAKDVSRVAEFFVEFSLLKAPKPVQPEMEKHITPVGSGGAAAPTNAQPKANTQIIYQSEIDKFYDDVLKGRYHGRHDEVVAIEAQIDAAVMDRRIRQG